MLTCRNTTILCLLICFASCGPKNYHTNTSAPLLGQPVIDNANNSFNDTGLFLAGLPLKKQEYKKLTGNKHYIGYKDIINKSWNTHFAPNRAKITEWRKKYLNNDYGKAVFYPFSGPDILHALTFYPDANEFVMFGLEPTGGIPDITKAEEANLEKQLHQFLVVVNFALGQSYFITKEMKVHLQPSGLNGITAIMMFFLVRGGYDIVQVKEISIAPYGSVVPWIISNNKAAANGVEILFTEKNSSEIKRVRYFSLNVENSSPQLATLDKYIEQYPPFTTIFKSASYLVWWGSFTKIRDLIMKSSNSILQDDTGIPYKILKDSPSWRITHFGKYHKPIPIFISCYQELLETDNAIYSKAPINFEYGYGYAYEDITYHLVWAQKIYYR